MSANGCSTSTGNIANNEFGNKNISGSIILKSKNNSQKRSANTIIKAHDNVAENEGYKMILPSTKGTAEQVLKIDSVTNDLLNLSWGEGGGGGGSDITVQDEGSSLATAATTLNFTGENVTATGTGATKTINITSDTYSQYSLETSQFSLLSGLTFDSGGGDFSKFFSNSNGTSEFVRFSLSSYPQSFTWTPHSNELNYPLTKVVMWTRNTNAVNDTEMFPRQFKIYGRPTAGSSTGEIEIGNIILSSQPSRSENLLISSAAVNNVINTNKVVYNQYRIEIYQNNSSGFSNRPLIGELRFYRPSSVEQYGNELTNWIENGAGHIIPSENSLYDIGSAEKKVRHLYLSSNSLNIGDVVLSSENDDIKIGGKKLLKEDENQKIPSSKLPDNVQTIVPAATDGVLSTLTIGGTSYTLPSGGGGGGTTTLAGLTDVSDTTPQTGDSLIYSSLSNQWIPQRAASQFGLPAGDNVKVWVVAGESVSRVGNYPINHVGTGRTFNYDGDGHLYLNHSNDSNYLEITDPNSFMDFSGASYTIAVVVDLSFNDGPWSGTPNNYYSQTIIVQYNSNETHTLVFHNRNSLYNSGKFGLDYWNPNTNPEPFLHNPGSTSYYEGKALIVVTYEYTSDGTNGQRVTIYKNGTQTFSASGDDYTRASTNTFWRFAGNPNQQGGFQTSKFYAAAVWDRVLTTDEISQLSIDKLVTKRQTMPVSDLSDITNVSTTAPSNGDSLIYSSLSSQWVPQRAASQFGLPAGDNAKLWVVAGESVSRIGNYPINHVGTGRTFNYDGDGHLYLNHASGPNYLSITDSNSFINFAADYTIAIVVDLSLQDGDGLGNDYGQTLPVNARSSQDHSILFYNTNHSNAGQHGDFGIDYYRPDPQPFLDLVSSSSFYEGKALIVTTFKVNTASSQEVTIYKNGTQTFTSVDTDIQTAGTNTYWYFAGSIHESQGGFQVSKFYAAAVWDRVLTTDEINQLTIDKLVTKRQTMPVSDLSDITNVSTTAPTDGQALVYDSANSQWQPGNVHVVDFPFLGGIPTNKVSIISEQFSPNSVTTNDRNGLSYANASIYDNKLYNSQITNGSYFVDGGWNSSQKWFWKITMNEAKTVKYVRIWPFNVDYYHSGKDWELSGSNDGGTTFTLLGSHTITTYPTHPSFPSDIDTLAYGNEHLSVRLGFEDNHTSYTTYKLEITSYNTGNHRFGIREIQLGEQTPLSVSTTAPTDGQALVYDSANSQWVPSHVNIKAFRLQQTTGILNLSYNSVFAINSTTGTADQAATDTKWGVVKFGSALEVTADNYVVLPANSTWFASVSMPVRGDPNNDKRVVVIAVDSKTPAGSPALKFEFSPDSHDDWTSAVEYTLYSPSHIFSITDDTHLRFRSVGSTTGLQNTNVVWHSGADTRPNGINFIRVQ